jgi:hypothetical protein
MRANILKKESDKQELISRLSNERRILMFFDEEVPGEDLPHKKVSESITLVPAPYNYETLEKWLYLGNWQAIFPGNKSYQPFNTFKTDRVEIEKRMKEAKVKLIVDSFRDDIEWNVIKDGD